LLAEILYRKGFRVKYLGDFYTTTDSQIDVTLNGCGYDVPDAYIVSYPLVDDVRECKVQVRGCDVVVAHKFAHTFSKVCYDLGIPFMPNFVSFFLPDSVRFWEVEPPRISMDVVDYTLTCALQAGEIVRLFDGKEVTIAPRALVVEKGVVRELEMKQRFKRVDKL